MKIKINNLNNQKFKYSSVSTPEFKGGLKINKLTEFEKDLFKKAAGVSTILSTAAVSSLANEKNNSNEKKLTLNKILLKNVFNMDMATKEAAIKSLRKTPKENRQAALLALNNIQLQYKQKNIDNSYRYTAITDFIPHINNENLTLFSEILNSDIEELKEKNQTRLDSYYVEEILSMPEAEENLEKFNLVKGLKNSYGSYKYKDSDIFILLKDPEIKTRYLKPVLQSDYAKDKLDIQINEIVKKVKPENERILPLLLNYKNNRNLDYYFSVYNISDILKHTNNDNIDQVEDLLKNDDYKWLQNKISKYGYSEIISVLNKNNSEILPILLDELKVSSMERSLITSENDICTLLKNVSNEDVDVFKECLYLKDFKYPDTYYYNRHRIDTIPEMVSIMKNSDLKPVAKELLETKVKNSNEFMRFDNINGIKELSEIILEQDKNKIENLNYILNLEENSQPRFKNMRDIVNLTNMLSNSDIKDKVLQILEIKGDTGYRFDDFEDVDLQNIITKDLDMSKFKIFANIKDTPLGGYSIDLKKVIAFVNSYKNLSAEQIPVPEILPPKVSLTQVLGYIDAYQKKALNINSLKITDKIMLSRYAAALCNLPEDKKSKFLFHPEALNRDVTKALSKTIMPVEIDNKAKVNLFKFVLSNKLEIENIIKNADFAKFKKKGLPLKYARTDFLKDLNNILDNSDESISTSVLEKLQIELNEDKTGYDGIINLLELNKNDETENKVCDICEKFILKNEINTGNDAFDNSMNALIKGMPEFINIIGKQPHGSHDYSIDIHILEVLKNCINHPDYEELPSLDKTRLKFAVLLHDIAKKEGVVDKSHQNNSALYARNILEKYSISQSVKDDIYQLVKNHHWLEALNTNADTIEALSCNFKNSNDFKMSKIFAYADLKAVSKSIFNAYSPLLKSKEVKKLEQAVEKNKQTGNAIFTSRIVHKDRIPTQEYAGKTYKVFDFNKYSDEKDLGEVGFVDGTKKEDLRFLLHTVSNVENLNIVETLSDVANDSVLSESFISLKNNASYYNEGLGVILETEMPNIINAYYENQGSGYAKNQNDVVNLRTSSYNSHYRNFIPSEIQKSLDITPEQYAILFDKISQKKFLTQISDVEEFDLDGKIIDGKRIREALKEAQDKIIGKNFHNEVVGANSKVSGLAAKEDKLENISPEYLNFAQHYNLPVYLLGKS